jgi:hypothetical protein
MAINVALLAAQMYLGILTQPRPKKKTFADLLESNKGNETRPIPYIRGRWKTTPQRIWLNDFKARAVERDSVWTDYLIGSVGGAVLLDTITVSYRYYVGQVLELCWGPINRVHQVYVKDLPCAVAPVVDNAGGSILLDDPQLFGGDQPPGEGGIYALCDVIAGNYTQGVNAYLQVMEGNVPALRGVAALVIRGPSGFTESGYISAGVLDLREWQVEVMSWPDYFGSGNARLADDSYNRVQAMYEWATNPDFGAQYPISNIHMSSWRAAEAQVFSEGLGFSGEINVGSTGEVFDQLKSSVDAEVYEHPRDGLKIKLVRKDYSLPTLKVLDESNTNNVEEYTPGDLADTFNRFTLNFTNKDNNFQPRPAVYEDHANFQLQQRSVPKELSYPGVSSAEQAQKLVVRDGRALASSLPPLTLSAGSDGQDLWPGEVFKFEWSDPFISKVMRVHERTPGLSYDGERNFRLISTEDQYSFGLSVFGAPALGDAVDPTDCLNSAPPSAEWDTTALPPTGLMFTIAPLLGSEIGTVITGAIQFGEFACGQYARIYVTEPGGVQTLSPMRLSPDVNNKAQFNWPALLAGEYEFCIETYSIITNETNSVKVCETVGASSPSMSPSASLSPSASASPSTSPSSSASPSVSPSSSFSPSLSPSASVSPSSSASPSPSPSTSPSASQSPSASGSPSASASPSASTSPSSSDSPSAAPVTDPEGEFDGRNLSGADGSSITLWDDSSGHNRDAVLTVGSGPILKTNILNGHSVCRCSAAVTALDFSGNSTDATFTIIAVVKCTDGGTRTIIADRSNGSNAPIFRINANKIQLHELDVGNVGTSTTSLNTTNFYTVAVTFDDVTNNFAFYLNGTADGSGTQAASFSRRFGGIGIRGGNLDRFLGDIAYVAYWNSVLDSSELTTRFNDLRTIWAHY